MDLRNLLVYVVVICEILLRNQWFDLCVKVFQSNGFKNICWIVKLDNVDNSAQHKIDLSGCSCVK